MESLQRTSTGTPIFDQLALQFYEEFEFELLALHLDPSVMPLDDLSEQLGVLPVLGGSWSETEFETSFPAEFIDWKPESAHESNSYIARYKDDLRFEAPHPSQLVAETTEADEVEALMEIEEVFAEVIPMFEVVAEVEVEVEPGLDMSGWLSPEQIVQMKADGDKHWSETVERTLTNPSEDFNAGALVPMRPALFTELIEEDQKNYMEQAMAEHRAEHGDKPIAPSMLVAKAKQLYMKAPIKPMKEDK